MAEKRIIEYDTAQEITETDFLLMDSSINGTKKVRVNDIGGGNSVTPNPTGTPTDTLNTIGIDGTVFDIAGSGSGSGVYIEEVLWEGTESTSAWASPIELAINIEPYDFIVVQIYNSMHVLSSRQIPTGSITGDMSIGVGGYINGDSNNRVIATWLNKDTNILRIFTSTGIPIEVTKIVGIKVSGNMFAPQIYSTEEREVGVWIDGSTVYEKIFDLGSDVSYGAGWHKLDIPKENINRIFDGLFISDSGVSCDVGLACNDTTYLEILVYSGTSQVIGRYIKARYTKTT